VLAGEEKRSPSFSKVDELGTPSVSALGERPLVLSVSGGVASRSVRLEHKGSSPKVRRGEASRLLLVCNRVVVSLDEAVVVLAWSPTQMR
jgi:hypothetical protein